jgi:DnaK suppressor protein
MSNEDRPFGATSEEVDQEEQIAAEELVEIKAMLLRQKEEIEERLQTHHADSDYEVGDEVDHSVNSQEQTLSSIIETRELERLQQIKDALKRIEDGEYGWCEETGAWIGKKRLMALPFTRLSLEAQMELERRESRNKGMGTDDSYANSLRE